MVLKGLRIETNGGEHFVNLTVQRLENRSRCGGW